MRIGRLTLLPILAFLATAAQDAPPQPKTPMATPLAATGPQAAKERELDDLILKAGQTGAAGDKVSAVRMLETALQQVQKDAALKGRENDVLNRLGRAYLDAQRPGDAVRTYKVLLEEMKAECAPNSPAADRCADAQYGMGTAQMYNGDFKAAVLVLRKSIANYSAIVKGGYQEDYRMSKLKLQADAQSLLAAALFRAGNKAEGIAAFEHAIQQFATVLKNPNSPGGVRTSAQTSMKDAQTSLDLLKKN